MVDRFQRIFDSLTEQVVVIDQDLRITYANRAWLDHYGFTGPEALGRPCHDLFGTGTSCPSEECAAQQAFDTGRPAWLLCQGTDKDSLLSASPILDSAGQVVEVALVSRSSDPHTTPAQPVATEAAKRAERLDVINRISLAVSSTLDLDQILQTAAREMAHVFDVKQTGIILFNPEQSYGRVAAEFQETPDQTGAEVRIPLADNPSLQHVMETKQPLAIVDARQDPLAASIRDVVEMRNIKSILIVPLVFKGEVIGTIGLDAIDTPRTFTPDEIELAETIANQVVVAIDNARLYEELSHHLEEVRILNSVALASTSTLDFDELVRRGMGALLGRRSFERVNVLLLDEVRNDLWLHPALADSDIFPQRADIRVPVGQGITGKVAQSGVPARVGNVHREPGYIAGYPDSLSELCVPLRVGERIIGVLDVQSTKPNAFSESDERLLTTLAGQLSTVLENSRLYAETFRRVRELSSLMEVSHALNEAGDLETILDIVLNQAFALVGTGEGSIILLDPPDSDRLRIVAHRGLGKEVVEAFNDRSVSRHEGTYRRALDTGQIVEVADTASDPDFLGDVGSRAQQVTNVPLIAERGPIGLIAVDGLPGDDTTRHLLMTLAGIAAVAIDKERLHQETVARLAEVSTLYTLSTQITSSLSTTSVLQSIVTILRMTLDCRACSIFLVDRTGEHLRLEVASGPSTAWKGIARMKVGEGISGRVIAEQSPIYIPDTKQESDFIFFDPQIRSLLVVPLLVRGEVIGTLSIDDTEPHSFDQEVRLMTIAAAQAAVAIENAQLYESLQSSYDELEHAFDELRHLDKDKSELIQNISHELRTPLTFIRGYIELLQDGDLGELLDEQKKAVDLVAAKSEVLSNLIDDIISMLKAGREQIRTGPVSISKIAHFAVQAARASAEEAGLRLVEEIPEGLPLVQGEMRRLGQVLDNLMQNAIKFTDAGGTITVRMLEEEEQIRVEVEDNGIGIPPDELDRIFERFYQVDGATARPFSGTGLGLAIVKQIVEAHGGKVGVRSTVDEGSIFHFTIPKAKSERR